VQKTFRFALAVVLATAMLDGAAQSTARSRPPGTTPLEDVPPPPAMDPNAKDDADARLQPQVTTRTEGDQTVQEYRIRGKLYMVRVTPKSGRGYVMMDNKGDGTFTRQDNTLDQGIRVPQWVLLEF
jgi:D-alanyl-D-alanine carboxypeptidase